MQRIAALIRANLRLRVFLPLLALALLTTWYGLGPSLAHFVEITGRRFVDMQPWLTPGELVTQARSYTPETVRFYIGWSLFDYAWPLLTFTTMLFIAAWLLRFLSPRWQAALPALATAGYATVLTDWGENLGFVAVILSRNSEPAAVAALAVGLHRAKLACNFAFNAGLFFVLGAVLVSRVKLRLRR